MPNIKSPTAINPGMTATQKMARKSLAQSSINPTAISGPRIAPTESSDCRKPKAAPRRCSGAMSATNASRGAPRTPLPTLSSRRAVRTRPELSHSSSPPTSVGECAERAVTVEVEVGIVMLKFFSLRNILSPIIREEEVTIFSAISDINCTSE